MITVKVNTVMRYLHSLRDEDASAVAEAIRGPAGDCPIDSPCGADMIAAINGARDLTAKMDEAGVFSAEARWAVWYNAKACCETFYHG